MSKITVESNDDDGIVLEGLPPNYEIKYSDFGDSEVGIYINKDFVDDVKVWRDSEMNGREYIIINHTIIYLDTIIKF